jgi:hypothetical protein
MNSDLHLLTEFGESLDPPDERPPADLRRRVLTTALANRSRSSTSGVRLAWRLGGLGAVAAAIAAAAIAGPAALSTGPAPPPAHSEAIAAPPDAAKILRLAAERTTAAPAPTARPDQFVYVESIDVRIRLRLGGEPPHVASVETLGPGHMHTWRSADGTRDGLEQPDASQPAAPGFHDGPIPGCRNGRQAGAADRPDVSQACTPEPAHRADLPTDPDAMLAYLYRPASDDGHGDYRRFAGPTSADQRAFVRVGEVIRASLTAPAVQSAAFEAAARIPGVTVVDNAVDVSGRPGVAVARTDNGVRAELVFDAASYRYLGSNEMVVGQRFASDRFIPGLKPGDVIKREAVLRVAVVDRPGQLP